MTTVSQEELEAAHCWEADDHVPRRPETTEFRRRVRLHQARWREAHGHPIGSQPIAPKKGQVVRPVGSRLPVDYARETGAKVDALIPDWAEMGTNGDASVEALSISATELRD